MPIFSLKGRLKVEQMMVMLQCLVMAFRFLFFLLHKFIQLAAPLLMRICHFDTIQPVSMTVRI